MWVLIYIIFAIFIIFAQFIAPNSKSVCNSTRQVFQNKKNHTDDVEVSKSLCQIWYIWHYKVKFFYPFLSAVAISQDKMWK